MATLTTVLLISLFGSVHCAGMCGPLVAFAMGATEKQTRRARLTLHAAYHGGQLVTYALMGAVCGALGAALDLGGSLVGLNRLAAILAGVMMVAAGTGSALMGAAVMGAFWVGTVPILLSLGVGVQALTGTLGRRAPGAPALVTVGLGLYTIAARPAISIDDVRPAVEPNAAAAPEEMLDAIQDADMPCCQAHGEEPSK